MVKIKSMPRKLQGYNTLSGLLSMVAMESLISTLNQQWTTT